MKLVNPRIIPPCLILPCLLVAATPGLAQETWQPMLAAVEEGVRTPTGTVRISIPALLSSEDRDNLAMEIDGIDFSGIMSVESHLTETTLSVTPPEPLAPGEHELRLITYSESGEIIERGAWHITVAPKAGIALNSLDTPVDIEIGYRLDEKDLEQPDDRLAASGNARLESDARVSQWSIAGSADLLLQTDHDQLVSELAEEDLDDSYALESRHDIELGEYLFHGERPGLDAMVGHHELAGGNLLVSDFNRRGVSLNRRVEDERLGGSVFAFRTEPVTGWNNGLGVGDEENRVLGAMATLRPLNSQPERLSIQAVALRGEGNDAAGAGIGGDATPGKGDGIALAVESRLAEDRIRLRGETAQSDFDADTTDADDTELGDSAARLVAELVPWRDAASQRSLSLGAEYQRVDRHFRSLANPTLPNDREMHRVFAGLGLGPVDLRMQYAEENNNVDGETSKPTAENRIRELLLNYAPEVGDGTTPWYGRPSISAGWRVTRTLGTPGRDASSGVVEDAIGTPGARETPYYHAGVALQHDYWGVDLSFARGDEENLLTGLPATGSRSHSLGFHWIPGPRYFFYAQWLVDRFDSGPGLPVLDTELLLLNAEIGLIPDRLSIVLDASLNRNSSNSDLLDDETRTLGLGIDWQPDRPGLRRHGATFWIRAEQEEFRDRLDSAGNIDPWQVLVGVRFALSSATKE